MNRTLLDKLPVISRARRYRLYSSNGRRIVDFFQDSGNTVLGHRLSGVSLSMKQAVDRGVFFSCKSRFDIRLKNAVYALAGNKVGFSVFTDIRSLFAGLNKEIYSSFFADENSDTVYWHPFSGDDLSELLNKYSFVIPVIPFPGNFSPRLILSKESSLPDSDFISPVLLSPFISVIYKLIKTLENNPYNIWDNDSSEIEKLWKRKGIYLIPVYNEKLHEKIFSRFLDKGYLISPDYNVPSILPGEISSGEKADFINTVKNISGEFI